MIYTERTRKNSSKRGFSLPWLINLVVDRLLEILTDNGIAVIGFSDGLVVIEDKLNTHYCEYSAKTIL